MAQVRQAVILAAGLGLRLGDALDDRPKAFIQLGSKSIVEESILKLIKEGISRIAIVTGYQSRYFDDLIKKYPEIKAVHNPDYKTTGTLHSLICAFETLTEDFLLVESDLIYEERALRTVLESDYSNCILLSGKTGAGDEVYADVKGDRLVGLSKDRRRIKQYGGELVGISRLSFPLFQDLIDMENASETNSMCDYEQGLTQLGDKHQLNFELLEDLMWAEIDDEHHLRRAQSLYPRIVEKDADV